MENTSHKQKRTRIQKLNTVAQVPNPFYCPNGQLLGMKPVSPGSPYMSHDKQGREYTIPRVVKTKTIKHEKQHS